MLGKYTVPKHLTEAEKNATTGELQPDFKRWVLKLIADLESEGIASIETIGDGFVSYPVAVALAASGDKTYIDAKKDESDGNARVALFCRGLAWKYVLNAPGIADWTSGNWSWRVRSYGLDTATICSSDGTVQVRFFYPKSGNIEYSDDAMSVTYMGDIDDNTGNTGNTGDRVNNANKGSVSSVAYFFSNQFNSFQDPYVSEMLQGERALANDEPVSNMITKVVQASLRSYSSTPDGRFVAWYPDYWGKAGNTPCMTIKDIELLDLRITQSDSDFYSHVYCTNAVSQEGLALKTWQSQGVVSIESDINARASEAEQNETGFSDVSDEVSYILRKILYIPEGEEWKYTPKELYRRYGARPINANIGSAQLVENVGEQNSTNPTYIMPFLYALYSFMEHWANQNKVDVDITFNPSIIPGCRIRLESLDVSFYVKGVTHTMDYSNGFTTKITAVCPTGSLVSGMVNV